MVLAVDVSLLHMLRADCPAALVQILWTYILSQAAAAVVQQPAVKGQEEPVISIPQQIAIAITEEEQIAAMCMVVEELATVPEEPTAEEGATTPAKPATV